MRELLRLLLMLGIAASAVTLVGSAIALWTDERRRLTRLSQRVLGGPPDGLIIAQGREATASFRIAANQVLVMRDGGAHALLYPLAALIGAELLIDDEVMARVAQGEQRRLLEKVPAQARKVMLRLMFDDPRHPDFVLDLWLPEDEGRRHVRPPAAVIQDARGWLTRAEAIMRRAKPVAIADATVDKGPPLTPEAARFELDFDKDEPPEGTSKPPLAARADEDEDFDEDGVQDDPYDDEPPFDLAPPAPQPEPAPKAEPPKASGPAEQLPLF